MLAQGKWFSSLNLKCAYWLVALHLDDKEKTAFSTGHRLAVHGYAFWPLQRSSNV
jgi:hypothetical protein